MYGDHYDVSIQENSQVSTANVFSVKNVIYFLTTIFVILAPIHVSRACVKIVHWHFCGKNVIALIVLKFVDLYHVFEHHKKFASQRGLISRQSATSRLDVKRVR